MTQTCNVSFPCQSAESQRIVKDHAVQVQSAGKLALAFRIGPLLELDMSEAIDVDDEQQPLDGPEAKERATKLFLGRSVQLRFVLDEDLSKGVFLVAV